MKRVVVVALAASIALHAATLRAQQGAYNPRDDQYRALGLVRAKAELRKATEEYDRAQVLASKGMLATAELSERRLAYERVKVDYLQQSLSTLFASVHLVVERATKRRRADGAMDVTVRLASVTNRSTADEKTRALVDSGLEAALQPDVIPAVFVSLKSEPGPSGITISKPYEAMLRNLRMGEVREIRFGLLKDVGDLVVSTTYADKTDERRVWLDNEGVAGVTSLRAGQFSLEGDFGAQVRYDLQLERTTMGNAAVRLGVAKLPGAIAHEFRDPETKARIVQVRLPEGQTQRKLQLVLSLPSAAEGTLRPDSVVSFSATISRERQRESGDSVIGSALLELIPRGAAHAELRMSSLFFESTPDAPVSTEVAIHNIGSRRLERVRLDVDPAPNWQARVEPDVINALELGEVRRVRLILQPRGTAAVGDYESRVRLSSATLTKRLDDEDKVVRVRVTSRSATWVTIAFFGAIVALAVGVVIAARKLSAR